MFHGLVHPVLFLGADLAQRCAAFRDHEQVPQDRVLAEGLRQVVVQLDLHRSVVSRDAPARGRQRRCVGPMEGLPEPAVEGIHDRRLAGLVVALDHRHIGRLDRQLDQGTEPLGGDLADPHAHLLFAPKASMRKP